jgi:hypothetical protein
LDRRLVWRKGSRIVTITAKRLEELGACRDQVDAFRAIWGDDPAPMTVEAALEHARTFSWEWAAVRLLAPSARAEYQRATAPAYDEFERALASARADLKRACARAFAEAYINQEAAK